jgi:hypothetical protein
MLGNLKIFSIALLMRAIMRRRFNVIQVLAADCEIEMHAQLWWDGWMY